MIRFRKLRIGDLDEIYQDDKLRPLITGKPKGRKFTAVAEMVCYLTKVIGKKAGIKDFI
ncbi:hypothetical protein QBE55_11165 [Eubacteriales bacterium mix99]|jgi:hypothetical protein